MNRQLILLGPLPPPCGGVAIFMDTLWGSLKNSDTKLWTYAGRDPQEINATYFHPKRLGLIPLLLREGRRARIADSSHFFFEYPNPLLVPLWTLLKLVLKFDWVKIIHDGSLPSRYNEFSPVRRSLFRLSAKFADEFIVVSHELQNWLLSEVKVRQKVQIIKSLLPLPSRAFDVPMSPEIEAKLTRYSKRVCSVGVFIPDYGFKKIADALEKIRRESGEDICLILIDGTFARDEDYQSQVLKDRPWITALNNVPRGQVLQIFKHCDLFVRGTRFESYGLTRVEAIWCGLPVVATRVGETRGMLLYDHEDEQSLVDKMKKTLLDQLTPDVQAWAKQFHLEAEENLRFLKKALTSKETGSKTDS